jgi:hypothetical protein
MILSANGRVALAYGKAGFFVFPCSAERKKHEDGDRLPFGKADKRPLVSSWSKDASKDESQIEEWWTKNPEALIGLPCKQNRLLVIDADRHTAELDGVANFSALCEGRDDAMPPHPVVHTDFEGEHHYFRMPEVPIGQGKNKLPPGVDIRGYQENNDGGYIIAAGSRMPDGRSWSLVKGTPSLLNGSLPVPTQWLIDLCRAPQIKPALQVVPKPPAKSEEAYALATLNRVARDLAATPRGNRDNALVSGSFTMGRMHAPGWIGAATIEGRLLDACVANGLASEEGEITVRNKIQRSIKAGMAVPHDPLPDRKRGNGYDATSQEPQPLNSVDPLRGFAFVNDESPAPQAMLIDDVLPLEGLPFIGGQSSAGKTFIAILMAACAATGKPFFGREVRECVGSVIVAAEGRAMLRNRILAALQKLEVDERNVPISWVTETPDFSNAQSTTAFIDKLKILSTHFQQKFAVRLGLVFVDTVSASFNLQEEADNAEAARVCKIMQRIAEQTAAIVVPIHHYGKNAAVGLRGASAWRASADIVLSVTADIDPTTGHVTNRQLSMAKDRDGAQGPITAFALKPVSFGIDENGKPFGSMVAVAEGESAKTMAIWPPALAVFKQALVDTLIASGKDEAPFPNGPNVRTVDAEAVKTTFATITHVESDNEQGRKEAIRKQFARKLGEAQSRRLIGVKADTSGQTKLWLLRPGDARPDTNFSSLGAE